MRVDPERTHETIVTISPASDRQIATTEIARRRFRTQKVSEFLVSNPILSSWSRTGTEVQE